MSAAENLAATMNPAFPFIRSALRTAGLTLTAIFAVSSFAADEVPTSLVFKVSKTSMIMVAPKAIKRVVVEEQNEEGWVPLSVQHLKDVSRKSDFLTLRLPRNIPKAKLRVLGYKSDRFDGDDVDGQSAFVESLPVSDNPIVNTTSGTGLVLAGSAALTTTTNTAVLANDSSVVVQRDTSTVVESDIWKVIGNKLFFFNQYRGLQALDLTDPLHPRKTGTMRLAASGEQFYALNADGSRLGLLGRTASGGRSVPTLYLVGVSSGVPTLEKKIELGGAYVLDSRLVGDRLYALVKGQDTYNGYPTYTYTAGSLRLVTVGLETNASASILDDVTLPVTNLWYGNQSLQIQGGKLVVAVAENPNAQSYYWWGVVQSKVHIFDISNSSGVPALLKIVQPKGFISDKFKLAVMGDNLVTTSITDSYGNFATASSQTWVETFPLAGSTTAALGQVELPSARGERLYATRYDSNRAYVVTFRNTDPLFIVDLTDPAAPTVTGELEIPGWSTYLEPHGDRLISVGVENWKVAVSLFDVSDPAAPTLLSRVYPGTDGYYSWSEANYDEKAVEYDAATGTLTVPFQSWTNTGYVSAIQEITVGENDLTLGATVIHDQNARRGNVINGYLVSISGQQLIVTDRASTSTTPAATLTLAWRVDQVLRVGDFLVQLEQGPQTGVGLYRWSSYWWGGSSAKAALRVSPRHEPDEVVSELQLGSQGVIGFTSKGSRVYVAQLVTINADDFLRTRILSISKTGVLTEDAMIDHKLDPDYASSLNFSSTQALWTNDKTLSWYTPVSAYSYYGYPWYWGGPIFISQPILVISRPLVTVGTLVLNNTLNVGNTVSRDGNNSGDSKPKRQAVAHICTIQGADTATPAAGKNRIIRGGENSPSSVSAAYAASGFVFFSYQDHRTVTNARGTSSNSNWWLQVLDMRDPSRIVARNAASIPGSLVGIHQADAQGAIVFCKTQSSSWSSDTFTYRTDLAIQAAAYDGVTAFQLDEWESSTTGWNTTPLTADGTRIFIAEPNPADTATTLVSTVSFDIASNKLTKTGSWTLPSMSSSYSLKASGGLLFASKYGTLETAAIQADGTLTPDGTYEAPSSLWLPVDRAINDADSIYLPALDYGVEILDR